MSDDITGSWLRAAGLENLELAATRHFARLVALIVAVALLVRLVVAFQFADLNPKSAELWEYGGIAASSLKYGAIVSEAVRPDGTCFVEAVRSDGTCFVHPTAFMPPLAVFAWMGLFSVFGVSTTALACMILVNVCTGAAIVFYTIRIARTLFGSSLIALAAGLVAAFHPVFVFSTSTYHVVNPYVLLLVVLFDLCSSRWRPSKTLAVAIGILYGVSVLARTEYLVLGFALVLGALLAHRKPLLTAISLLTAFAVVVPWTARNYVVFHRFLPVTDSTGYALYKGFNPYANGSGHWVDFNHVAEKTLGPELARVPQTDDYEIGVDAVYRSAVGKFVATEPFRAFVSLPIRKVLLFWVFDIYDPMTHRLLYQLAFWPIFLLSAVGFIRAARLGLLRNPDHRTVVILFLFQTLVMAAYATHARYRMNVEPFLFGYAAFGALGALGTVAAFRPALRRG